MLDKASALLQKFCIAIMLFPAPENCESEGLLGHEVEHASCRLAARAKVASLIFGPILYTLSSARLLGWIRG